MISAALSSFFAPFVNTLLTWVLWPLARVLRVLLSSLMRRVDFLASFLRALLRLATRLFQPLRSLVCGLHQLLVNNRVLTALLLLYRQTVIVGGQFLTAVLNLWRLLINSFTSMCAVLSSAVRGVTTYFERVGTLFQVLMRSVWATYSGVLSMLSTLARVFKQVFTLFAQPIIKLGNLIVQPFLRHRNTISNIATTTQQTAQQGGRMAGLINRLRVPFQVGVCVCVCVCVWGWGGGVLLSGSVVLHSYGVFVRICAHGVLVRVCCVLLFAIIGACGESHPRTSLFVCVLSVSFPACQRRKCHNFSRSAGR
jgi:hypothetical protein